VHLVVQLAVPRRGGSQSPHDAHVAEAHEDHFR
jgi:hypothetical protein